MLSKRKEHINMGLAEAKKRSKQMLYFWADDFSPKGLKKFLEQAGAPKHVVKNSHLIAEVSFELASVEWKTRINKFKDPFEASRYCGWRNYIALYDDTMSIREIKELESSDET